MNQPEPVWNPVREADSLENRRARWLDTFYPHIARILVDIKLSNGDVVKLWDGNVRSNSIMEMSSGEDVIRIQVLEKR